MSKGSILVADDVNAIKLFWDRLLTKEGYEVTTVGTVAEISQLIKLKRRFDYALLDLNLSDNDSTTIMATILEEMPGIEVIVLSGTLTQHKVRYLGSLGVRKVLVKPVDKETILGYLRG